jgi:hypothetical protein
MADREVWIEFDEDFLPPFKGIPLQKRKYCEGGELYYSSPHFTGGMISYNEVKKLARSGKYEVGPEHTVGICIYGYVKVPKCEILKILNEEKIFWEDIDPQGHSRFISWDVALIEYVESFPDDRLYKLVHFVWD